MQVTEPTSEVPDHIRPNHLIKELTKEVRYLEVREQQPANQDPVCGQAVYQKTSFDSYGAERGFNEAAAMTAC